MHHTNRKFLVIVCLLFVIALLFTSCGPEDQASAPAEVAPATVRWITWDRSSQAEALLIDQFHKQYPHVEFKREEVDYRWRDLFTQTPPPDLLNMDVNYDFGQMIEQNQLADLSELWDQTGLLTQVPASLQKLSEHNGKQFYVPFGFGWVGFYYNKAIFAQYNLQPPQSWEEFMQICDTLRTNGEIPLSIAGSEPWSSYEWFEYLDLRLNGPTFHQGLLSGKEHFNDARVRHVAEIWKSLFDKEYYVQDAQLLGGLNALTALVRTDKAFKLTGEKAVMALSDAYNASQMPGPFMNELGFFRFPSMDASVPKAEAIDPFGYVMPVGAEHIPQTLAFLRQLSTPEGQALVAQAGLYSSVTYAPARSDVDLTRLRFDQSQAVEMLKATDEAVPLMWLALPETMWGMMTYHFTQFVRERDVDKFIASLEEARQKALDQGLLKNE
jgi:multiple sugar transport system substrate-binding protein/raffinose/stachyose/melibiose transport system substrate-binding protein